MSTPVIHTGLKARFVSDFETQRKFTPEGYLVAPAKIARTGIQVYSAGELGLQGIDANKRIRLYRPPEEVFNPEAMASFDGKPTADNHPPDGISANNWRQLATGDVHDIEAQGPYLGAKVIFRDQAAIEKVIGGKTQLSCGYQFDADMTSGTDPEGNEYDGIQRRIRGNHVATVDAGRAGPAVRVADTTTDTRRNIMATSLHTIKIGDADITLDLDENMARSLRAAAKDAVDRHDREMGDAKRALGDAKDALKGMKDAHDELGKELVEHKKARDAAESALAKYQKADKDKDDDGDEGDPDEGEETGDSKKTGDALVLYAKSVAKRKRLKAKIPTADQLHAMAADLATVIGDAKKVVGDAIDMKGKTVAEIRSAVVTHVITAKDAALKATAVAVIGGEDVAKAPAALIDAAFRTLVAKPAAAAGTGANDAASKAAADAAAKAAADKAATDLGAAIRRGGSGAAGAGKLSAHQKFLNRTRFGGFDSQEEQQSANAKALDAKVNSAAAQ